MYVCMYVCVCVCVFNNFFANCLFLRQVHNMCVFGGFALKIMHCLFYVDFSAFFWPFAHAKKNNKIHHLSIS
jgi:hypothetical protein